MWTRPATCASPRCVFNRFSVTAVRRAGVASCAAAFCPGLETEYLNRGMSGISVSLHGERLVELVIDSSRRDDDES